MSTSSATTRLKVIHGHLKSSRAFSLTKTNPSRFQYTLDDTVLTESQRLFYEQNGYLVFKKLVPTDLVQTFTDHFRDMCNGKVEIGMISMVKDISLAKKGAKGEYLYNKAQDFVWDDVLYGYISYSKILNIVKSFTGPNITAVHTMLINKPPDAGTLTSRHPLHQDLHYFPFRPAERVVCAWTALEKVTRENGCLVVVPESHKGPLYSHDYPVWEGGVNKAYHGIVDNSIKFSDQRVHLEMEKGDTVFFHPLLIHGSGANRTQGFRKAISCHYAASECNYIDVKGTTQENIAKEVEGVALEKFGANIDYRDFWRARRRIVTGEEINL